MFLIDSHTHLSVSKFDEDRDQVLQRAHDHEVNLILEIGFNPEIAGRSLRLAENHDAIYAAIGLHPHDAHKHGEEWFQQIRDLVPGHPKILAIGEIGLDYYYKDIATPEQQQQCFRSQIQLAKELKKPVVIHCREAQADTLRILEEEHAEDIGGIMHCFSGTLDDAKRSLDLGFVLGIGGTITYKKSPQREFITQIPLDSLVLETDCPWLAPVPFRGKRNEPARVRHIAGALAELYQVPLEVIAEKTTTNFERLFGITVNE
ncbi:MAG: TatD family deoxyribonuclease [Gemmatimonadetes bacterium]|nr:MAG: TatD family deoxyribonuclease [Gemmatimonadota bacterium]